MGLFENSKQILTDIQPHRPPAAGVDDDHVTLMVGLGRPTVVVGGGDACDGGGAWAAELR